ncbi:predicted protein [Naegleria gruberi]|uniref:Predicted protein n=1 Tax=Naegleria gruberi TaxID=5762 RepID=D2V1X3_NAEGR|nr:uncharacterized protein NAEGRDRAFT_62726 [Naegleria gruberi]EFC49386.1 predicted protein [Naegleria gruberi]|eukprot:XP_002682130.1 predicted protein [Naegleria gruberi strain NEG-M]
MESAASSSSEIVTSIIRNPTVINCPHCNSKILRENMGLLVEDTTFELPVKDITDTKSYNRWYQLKDMFDFENIGFTKNKSGTAQEIKYLTCADCEREAIGIAFMNEKKFYLAIDLVKEQ